MHPFITTICLVVVLSGWAASVDTHIRDCSYLRPYQVVLFSQDDFLCLGNLISLKTVLTCCQCFIRLDQSDAESKILTDTAFTVRENVIVKAGFHCSDGFKQYRHGESYAFDPDCKRERGIWEHDAAIMTVNNEFHLSSYVAPMNHQLGQHDADIIRWTLNPKNFAGVKCYVEGLWHSKRNGSNFTKSVNYPVQYDKCPVDTEYNLCAFHPHPLKGFCSNKNLGSALVCKDLVIGYLTEIRCNKTEVKMTFHKISLLDHLIWAALQPPGSSQYSAASIPDVSSFSQFYLLIIIHLMELSRK